MKLDQDVIDIDRSAKSVEHTFGIKDNAIVIQLLRENIYKDPIKACCQEIISNAYDAHTEAKRPNIQIEVTLPTNLDPTLKIRDFGNGMTPKIIESVYRHYGSSTKRDSNDQIGGFGIGCKTPFAISDTYTLTSIVEQNGHNHKRQYVCFLDESGCGKITEVISEKTTEKTGVEVSIPITANKVSHIEQALIEVTRFWPIRPKFTNKSLVLNPERVIFDGKNLTVFNMPNVYGILHAVIGVIPYDIDKSIISRKNNICDSFYTGHKYVFKFDIGELSVSASRESLRYNDRTIDNVIAKMKAAKDEFVNFIVDDIKKVATFKDRVKKYLDYSPYQHLLGGTTNKAEWKGLKIDSSPPADGRNLDVRTYSADYSSGFRAVKYGRHYSWQDLIGDTKNTMVFLSRSSKIDRDLIYGAMKKYGLTTVKIIVRIDQASFAALNGKIPATDTVDSLYESYIKACHFDDLGLEYIEDVPPIACPKASTNTSSGRSKVGSTKTGILYTLTGGWSYTPVNLEDIEAELKKEKQVGVYVPFKSRKCTIFGVEHGVTGASWANLVNCVDRYGYFAKEVGLSFYKTVYAVHEDKVKKLDKKLWKPIEVAAKEVMDGIMKNQTVMEKLVRAISNYNYVDIGSDSIPLKDDYKDVVSNVLNMIGKLKIAQGDLKPDLRKFLADKAAIDNDSISIRQQWKTLLAHITPDLKPLKKVGEDFAKELNSIIENYPIFYIEYKYAEMVGVKTMTNFSIAKDILK